MPASCRRIFNIINDIHEVDRQGGTVSEFPKAPKACRDSSSSQGQTHVSDQIWKDTQVRPYNQAGKITRTSCYDLGHIPPFETVS